MKKIDEAIDGYENELKVWAKRNHYSVESRVENRVRNELLTGFIHLLKEIKSEITVTT